MEQTSEQALMQGIGGSGGRSASQAVAGRLRTFYYVFMTTLWTAFTLLPARFFNIWRVIQHDQQLTCSQILFNFIFVNLVTLNSVGYTISRYQSSVGKTLFPVSERGFFEFAK